MSVIWMGYAIAITAALAVGAKVVDWTAPGSLRGRRWVWLGAMVLAAGMPTLAFLTAQPTVRSAADRPTAPATGSLGVGQGVIVATSSTIADLIARAESSSLGRTSRSLLVGWAIMIAVAVVVYGAAVLSLARRRQAWARRQLDGQMVLVARSTGPAVVGALRPDIVVPEWAFDLPVEQRALMLEHERQHVRARDPLLLHSAVAIALAFPWNLGLWWLVRQLRLAVELDCDARVLASGRDSRAYGMLLLDVCARRVRPGLVLAPALFERTSSLTRRILAMHPSRIRYARTRATLGVATAIVLTVLACDMPSPEAVAPDGTNQATQRLYGAVSATADRGAEANRAFVARYFPAVARGEGGPTILMVVKSHDGVIVKTSAQPAAELARVSPDGRGRSATEKAAKERAMVEASRSNVVRIRSPESNRLAPRTIERRESALGTAGGPARPRGMPSALASLEPNEIEAVEVSKHAAGAIAPQAVSMVTITLKPGATFARSEQK